MENIKQTFELVYQATHHKVKIYLMKHCKDISDVNDILQDTYLDYYGILDRKGIAHIKNSEALLMRIARKKIYKHYQKWDKVGERITYDDAVHNDLDETMEPGSQDIADEVVNREMVQELYQQIMKKPGEVQKIFYMYYQMELSLREIADLLDMKESTVKSKLYRTIKELRKEYEKKGAFYEGKGII